MAPSVVVNDTRAAPRGRAGGFDDLGNDVGGPVDWEGRDRETSVITEPLGAQEAERYRTRQ